MFYHNAKDFLPRFVIVDETWSDHYIPEYKQQSRQWVTTGDSDPKKAKTVLSTGKMIDSVFWDSQGNIMIVYLEKGEAILKSIMRHYWTV